MGVPGFELIERPWANGVLLTSEQWCPFVVPPPMFAEKPT